MKEDLIRLREQLHNNQKYVIIDEYGKTYSDELTMENITELENTDEVIDGMEEIMKKGVIAYYQSGIPLDTVGIAADVRMISTKDFAKKVAESGKNYKKYWKEYWNNARKYIHVSFDLCSANCFETESGSTSPNEPKCYEYKEVSGIVDFDKFISKLKALGYNLTLLGFDDTELSNCEQFKKLAPKAIDQEGFLMFNLIVPLVKENDSKDNDLKTR